jgi:flagellar basal body-associated protein FliL
VKKKMIKTNIILIVLAMSLVVVAAIGVTFAQHVNAQNQNGVYSQTPQGYNGNYGNLPPNTGNSYSQVPQRGAYPYRMGVSMGMCGRYW